MPSFKELTLIHDLVENISRAGYENPTPIQEKAIPSLLAGKDLLGIADTGTGKTASFCLPLIQRIVTSPKKRSMGAPRALIIAPTRELCSQIVKSIAVYSAGMDVRACAIFGGVGQKEQEETIKEGIDVVVATPGRLLDLMEQRILRLSMVEVFVLDEADRMLDMGFAEELDRIIDRIPEGRQTMLFSATMPLGIVSLANGLLSNPIRVQVAAVEKKQSHIEQKIIYCKTDHKFQLLKKILKEEPGLALVFTTSKIQADLVAEYLVQNRIATGSIHADKKQSERERHLNNFKNKAIKVLVASDIAARGIDVEGITHVINFELPLSAETYLHRIGRTGRAGNSGKAISFVDESESHLLEKIKRAMKEEIPSEKFEGKFEKLNLKASLAKKVRVPTPGVSQEKTAYLDHSKRNRPVKDSTTKKIIHPGFKKSAKKRR